MMTRVEARNAFIRACEKVEHVEPIGLPHGTPVLVAGTRYRIAYDPRLDETVLMPEVEWRQELERARGFARAEQDLRRSASGQGCL